MLRRRKKTIDFTEIDLNALKELREASPAKVWVNLLLLHMCRNSVSSLTLQRSKGIPPIPLEEEVPPGGFDFDRIINRLKVLAALDPVAYKEPRKGKISLCIHGTWYDLETTFTDSVGDSRCEITAQRREPQ
jgi:hypothetical protein